MSYKAHSVHSALSIAYYNLLDIVTIPCVEVYFNTLYLICINSPEAGSKIDCSIPRLLQLSGRLSGQTQRGPRSCGLKIGRKSTLRASIRS